MILIDSCRIFSSYRLSNQYPLTNGVLLLETISNTVKPSMDESTSEDRYEVLSARADGSVFDDFSPSTYITPISSNSLHKHFNKDPLYLLQVFPSSTWMDYPVNYINCNFS